MARGPKAFREKRGSGVKATPYRIVSKVFVFKDAVGRQSAGVVPYVRSPRFGPPKVVYKLAGRKTDLGELAMQLKYNLQKKGITMRMGRSKKLKTSGGGFYRLYRGKKRLTFAEIQKLLG